MPRPHALLLAAAITCLPMASSAIAQDKPAVALRTFEASKQTNARLSDLTVSLRQRVDTAFKGEEKLKAAMTADLRAIQAEKNPQTRKSLAAAYQAKYAKDTQRILGKANIDMQGVAAQMRAAHPGMTFTVTGTAISGQTVTAQSQPSPPRPPVSLDTVKDLQGPDYRFIRDSDCASGWGDSTRSGGFMKSESEGCQTMGEMFHEFEIAADKKGRVEMTANLASESHTISTSANSGSGIRLIRLSDDRELDAASVSTFVSSIFGDDAFQDYQGASIVRDLPAGRYRVEGYTQSRGSTVSPGWAVAEAKVQTMRVRIITSPK